MRVIVFDGRGEGPGKLGTYTEDVEVHFILKANGSLQSLPNAEERPPDSMLEPGDKIMSTPGNPKLVLDDGTVKYGCQVWWQEAPEEAEAVS